MADDDQTIERPGSRGIHSVEAAAPPSMAVDPRPEYVEFSRLARLGDAELRGRLAADHPDAVRLAASWWLLLAEHGLPRSAPSDGLRQLLLLGPAGREDLELLAVLIALDPCAGVRANAAALAWRVAHDRDRVIDVLITRLHEDSTPRVLTTLLGLDPPLPMARVESAVHRYSQHPSAQVRMAARSYCVMHTGRVPDEPIHRD